MVNQVEASPFWVWATRAVFCLRYVLFWCSLKGNRKGNPQFWRSSHILRHARIPFPNTSKGRAASFMSTSLPESQQTLPHANRTGDPTWVVAIRGLLKIMLGQGNPFEPRLEDNDDNRVLEHFKTKLSHDYRIALSSNMSNCPNQDPETSGSMATWTGWSPSISSHAAIFEDARRPWLVHRLWPSLCEEQCLSPSTGSTGWGQPGGNWMSGSRFS